MIQAAQAEWGVARRTGTGSIALVLFGAFLATVLIRTAWIADGAFVDLRTVANVVAGHGLRWNVDERVQTFTSPLWVIVLSLVTVIVRDPYAATLLTAIALTLAAATVLGSRIAVNPLVALIGVAVLTFSRSFVEYATSGFPIPLAYLLVVLFCAAYFQQVQGAVPDRPPFRPPSEMANPLPTERLLVGASLILLTDWTVLVAVGPALLATMRRTRPRLRDLAVGVSPVILWLLFAAFYYRAIVPTPLVAAWNAVGTPLGMLRQGLAYLLDALDADPLTVAAIGLAAAGGFRVRELRHLSIGLVLSIAVVLLTGGDVMSGRALAVPLLLAAIIVVRFPSDRLGILFVPALAAVVALGLVAPESPVLTGAGYHRETQPLTVPWPNMSPAVNPARAAIRDERRNFYSVTGLLTLQRIIPMPEISALEREVEALAAERRVIVDDRIGLFAYVAGTRLHFVDPDGRTDAFLARQPPAGEWRPGPRPRDVRPDYVAAVERRVNGCPSCGSETAANPVDGSAAVKARNR